MRILIAVIISSSLFYGCMDRQSGQNEAANAGKSIHWGYKGESAPEHWADIEKDSDCSGKYQSPIDIIEIVAVESSPEQEVLNIQYSPNTYLKDVVNNGHSIQFDFEKGDSIYYRDRFHHLKQIHFHEPSEHTVNGVRYPIEIHLVHENEETDDLIVLSIFGIEGLESDIFEFLESFLPIEINETREIMKGIDLNAMFPENLSYYSYKGSLTTPPCTEHVNWVVFKSPIVLSRQEIYILKQNMPLNNYRNEQPLNGRIVQYTDMSVVN